MLETIATILGGAKTATELLSSLSEVIKDREGREELLKLNTFITDLSTKAREVDAEYADLLRSKDAIEKELIQYKDWDAKAAKYETKQISPGWWVMALKGVQPGGDTPAYFCPKCFQNHKESILQGIDVEAVHYECTAKCGFETPRTFPTPPPQININLPRGRRLGRG